MRGLLAIIVMSVALFAAASGARAQDQDHARLFRDFDAAQLTRDDKRFLQAALAFEGHYRGMLDGDWGRLSREAMARFSRRDFDTATEDWHMAFLAWSFFDQYQQDGWEMKHIEALGLSLLLPRKTLVTDPPSENFANFRHSRSSLAISAGILSKRTAQAMHDFTARRHAAAGAPYTVRRDGLAITSATARDGSTLYTRSDLLRGGWSTIMLSADRGDGAFLNAVSSSITVGRAAPLTITSGGHLDRTIRNVVAFLEDEERQQQASRSARAEPAQDAPGGRDAGPGGAAGSGFVVSPAGHVLTNAHVVRGCRRVLVDGKPARQLAISHEFDLALLQMDEVADKAVAVFSAGSARLNSDVTAIGFPYAGLLGGLNVTRGSVAALKGLGGDATTMQITAPVQSGNSGGPLLASDGEVVGVVVSKLDVMKVAEVTGDLPQNVNFAIRGEIAQLFLAQNGVSPQLSLSDEPISPETLAERGRGFTTFVECE